MPIALKVVDKTDWRDVDTKMTVAADVSSGGTWQQNVLASLQSFPNLIPEPSGGAICGT